MPVATGALIVSAILGIAGTATSAGMQNKARREAGKEQKDLAFLARDDDQDKQFKDYKLNLEGLQINKDTLALKNREMSNTLALNSKMMRQQQLGTLGNALNAKTTTDAGMRNFILSLYGKTGGK